MKEIIVETKQLTKKYGSEVVVDQANIMIEKGDIYGFLGPNGAGKTTTIKMILGLIRPTDGEVDLFGKPFAKNRRELLKKVGSLVENPSYYGHLTGKENLEIYKTLLHVKQTRIEEVLEIVRLTHAKDKKVKNYSLGMKQRLGIAMALLHEPELVILDEPTNGLDPSGIQEIRELIIDMPKKYGITVLVSSHLLSEIEQMATKVGIILNGRLIFQDRLSLLKEHYSKAPYLLEVDRTLDAELYLKRLGYQIRQEKGLLKLDKVKRSEIPIILKQLLSNQMNVYRVEQKNASLEEIFLEVTRKEGEAS